MVDDGDEPSSDDLWADTRPEGSSGSSTSDEPPGPDPTGPDPTLVQPVVGGPVLPPAGPSPGAPPPGSGPPGSGPPGSGPPGSGPPGSGPPGSGPPPGRGGPADGPPPWLLPTAAAMIGLLVIGLVVALVVRDDGDDDTTATTLPLIGTSEPSSTIAATSTTITLEPSTSSTAPTTAAATTVPATTPPTTVATTTTTVVPTTTTTAAPVPALPDPGFAVVDGQTVQIARSCLVVPLEPATADLQVVSHLLPTIDGRLVLDRFSDGGSNGLDGTFVDTGTALQATVLDGGPLRGPFTATLRPADGGPDVDVAVNPDPGRSVDCLDTIRTRDADDSERSQYTHAILDVCTVRPDDDRLDVAGIGSDGARFTVDDNGDGTVELRFTDRRVGDLTDPDATASFDESIAFYEGVVSGGGDELVVRIEVELAAPRSCSPTEAP